VPSAAISEDIAVRVDGVSKVFRLPQEQVHTLKERALHPTRRRRFDRLEALRDVSLEVRSGEFFGIVGRNGSGKSTLMKCLAGIYRADAGEMWLRGRLAPFIELGVGFNPDLTARDNVRINAVMLGLDPAQARERYPSIIEFAELEEFEDLKLKNYSSGMQVRLAFSVMVNVDADVLLIDEVLAVGDASFQQKCHDALNAARDAGRTVLLVTHDMGQVQRFCDRAMLLERGEVVALGEARTVARRYMQLNFAVRDESGALPQLAGSWEGDGTAVIIDAWAQDGDGVRGQVIEQGTPCAVVMRVQFEADAEAPVFGFVLNDEQHRPVLAASSDSVDEPTGRFSRGDVVDVWASFDNWYAPGRYYLTPRIAYPGDAGRVMASREDMASILVAGSRPRGGLVDVPVGMAWRLNETSTSRAGA